MNRPILVPTWVFLLIFCLLTGGVLAAITITPGAPSALPSGAIVLGSAAGCPSGTTEYMTARGRVLVGVPSGGTIEGTVGTALTNTQNAEMTPTFTGSALATHTHTLTAEGTVAAPVFTGSALATHSHQQTISISATEVFRLTDDTYGLGADNFTAESTSTLTNDATGGLSTQLVSSVSGGTPAGTNTAPNFTGSSATSSATGPGTPAGTNSAVTTGGIAPYIQLRLCQQ